ncbi:tyrosinase family protein|uniref:tyrosinase family protein n=1 Tax=Noviherbaspirillum sp. L7-7A TaxID=2850560 RepID=UPI001C2BFC52|nr:tyrosinase family protein [Noviherbaspirillum sp. L7-7A]MBV0877976.1 tyrosinase family protein [Noviherbaspirillum sp. L7-7A]
MHRRVVTRRGFLKGASALLAAALPGQHLLAQSTAMRRLDWNTFRNTRDYGSLVDGISRMRENTNASDKRSWAYWTNIHLNSCPHGIAYFLAWHRGYLYYFEQQLRAVSGNKSLVLPYWDYYTTPEMPGEFTNPSPFNPLYLARQNTNVIDALTLAPFASTVTNMQRGLANPFEVLIEDQPHNPVHNIIGTTMATLQSPTDPIFWLHHANIDRLWSAWQQAGGGRTTPPADSTYWAGTFTYANRLAMQRSRTIDTRNQLSYYYQNETMPTSLPAAQVAQAGDGGFVLASMRQGDSPLQLAQLGPRPSGAAPRLLLRPAIAELAASPSRQISGNRLAVGGVLRIPLNENSLSVQLQLDQTSADLLQRTLSTAAPQAASPYRSARVVLDSVRISGSGDIGGYFYHLYLNLPSSTDVSSATAYRIGSVGPFEIDAAAHRVHMRQDPGGSEPGTVALTFALSRQLSELVAADPRNITLSFVRVSGNSAPGGEVIRVGEARLELSTDTPQ